MQYVIQIELQERDGDNETTVRMETFVFAVDKVTIAYATLSLNAAVLESLHKR